MGLFSWGKKQENEVAPVKQVKNDESNEESITPEIALARLKEAKESGVFLGAEYSIYANIAGQPFEDEMLKELDVISPEKLYAWEDKQKKDGKFLTNRVFQKVKALKEIASNKRDEMLEMHQKALAFEAEEKIDEAIAMFEKVCENYRCPLFSVERLAILYRNKKETDKEIKLCETFLSYHEDDFADRINKIRTRLTKLKKLKQ
jgi:DNA-binding Lrp family transcriptional regulator